MCIRDSLQAVFHYRVMLGVGSQPDAPLQLLHGVDAVSYTHLTGRIVKKLKDLENEGYQCDGADSSFELLIQKNTGAYRPFSDVYKRQCQG